MVKYYLNCNALIYILIDMNVDDLKNAISEELFGTFCSNNLKNVTAEDLFDTNIPKSSYNSQKSDKDVDPKNQQHYGERKRIKP